MEGLESGDAGLEVGALEEVEELVGVKVEPGREGGEVEVEEGLEERRKERE